MPRSRAEDICQQFAGKKVFVLGDLMLDHFLWGSASRISPEAPVPVVLCQREEFMPGGAGNVANNLATFGAHCILSGVVGEDLFSQQLCDSIATKGVSTYLPVVQPGRSTSKKTRVVAQHQQVVRVDRETLGDITDESVAALLALLEEHIEQVGALILTDYAKGVLTQSLVDAVIALCRQHKVWVSFDPKPSHGITFKGVSLMTPNRKETFELAGLEDLTYQSNPFEDASLMQAIDRVHERFEAEYLLSTLGELGMMLCFADGRKIHIPTVAQKVFDVSGAGDTVIASATLAMAAGASMEEAAVLANHAAGIAVGKLGTATVSIDELLQHLGV